MSIVSASVSVLKAGWIAPVHRGGLEPAVSLNPAAASSAVNLSSDSMWKCCSAVMAYPNLCASLGRWATGIAPAALPPAPVDGRPGGRFARPP